MNEKIDLLQLCKGLKRSNKKAQMVFVSNLSHKTLHQISEIFYNIQFLTDIAPPKIRKKLICGMKKNAKQCRYISNRYAKNVTKIAQIWCHLDQQKATKNGQVTPLR